MWCIMKVININSYQKYMGTLIDVRHPADYAKEKHHTESVNIYYDKVAYNPSKYLEKDKKYYITCKRGTLSRKLVRSLEILGYDVTLAK